MPVALSPLDSPADTHGTVAVRLFACLQRISKSGKIDLYSDPRAEARKTETNENWSVAKLNSVVNAKHGTESAESAVTKTDIVCKHFLNAVEMGLYGWFWKCPDDELFQETGKGNACKYQHCLPVGFVLKKKKTGDEDDEEDEGPTLEEIIEEKRAALSAEGTPVTLETFNTWKACKLAEKEEVKEEEKKEKVKGLTKQQKAGGVGLSGRALFEFKPDVFVDDDEAGDDEDFALEELKGVGAFEVDEEPAAQESESLFDDPASDSLFDEEDSLFNDEDEQKDPLEVAKEMIDVARQMEDEGDLRTALSMCHSALQMFGGPGSRPKLEQRVEALKQMIAEEDSMEIDESLFSDDSDDEDAPPPEKLSTIFVYRHIKIEESLFLDDVSDEEGDETEVDASLFEDDEDGGGAGGAAGDDGTDSDEDLSEFID
eukprot:SAG22_NODE_1165_length_5292_cov_9.601964_2_plen_429_part_00